MYWKIYWYCYREQATELLKRGWPSGEEPRYDSDAVLVLCRMRHFREGLLFLFEQMRLFREVLQVAHQILSKSCYYPVFFPSYLTAYVHRYPNLIICHLCMVPV